MYETPENVCTPNAVEDPTVYTVPDDVRYIKRTNEERRGARTESNEDGEEHYSSVKEPQVYEVAVSTGSHNEEEGQVYEEPKDSLQQYNQSQEVRDAAQQPYEIPVHTLKGGQGASPLQQQASKSPAASMGRKSENPPTYTSLYPGTLAEPQTYTLVRHTPDEGVYSVPSEENLLPASPREATPSDNHQYFVLNSVEKSTSSEPLYSELEDGVQQTESTGSVAVGKQQADGKRGHMDSHGRNYLKFQNQESSGSGEKPKEGSSSAPEEHPYFILEK